MCFNLFDYIIIAIILLSILHGLRKGFVKALGGMLGVLLAIILAAVCHDDIVLYMEEYYGVCTLLANLIRDKFSVSAMITDQVINIKCINNIIFEDMAEYLAFKALLIGSFVIVLLLGSKIIKLGVNILDHIFHWGVLSWINGILGMLFMGIKTFIVMAVVLGLIVPVIKTGSIMGWTGAMVFLSLINDSILAEVLLDLFAMFGSLLGLNA